MKREEVIRKINEVTGLGLELSEKGSVNFIYNERNVLMHFDADLGTCIIYVELTYLSPGAVSIVLPRLLEANFLFSQTNGGALSYLSATNMVSMNFMFPFSEDSDSADFISTLNRALSAADECTKKIKNMNREVMQMRSQHLQNLLNGVSENPTQSSGSPFNFMHL